MPKDEFMDDWRRDTLAFARGTIRALEKLDGVYDEKAAAEFHRKRNEMRLKVMGVLNYWFDGQAKIDPDCEMVWQLTDLALGNEVKPAEGSE